MQLEAVSALWDEEPSRARELLNHAAQITRDGLTEARRTLHALRASPLDEVGLAVAVGNLARQLHARNLN